MSVATLPLDVPRPSRLDHYVWAAQTAEEKKLKPNRARVLQHLAHRANRDGKSWWSQEEIAEACQMSPRTVGDCLSDLRDMDLVDRKKRYLSAFVRKTDLYRINAECVTKWQHTVINDAELPDGISANPAEPLPAGFAEEEPEPEEPPTDSTSTTPPIPPNIADQGGGGREDLTGRRGEEPAPAPTTGAAPPPASTPPVRPEPTPPAPTDPDDLRSAVEALHRIGELWGLQGEIHSPELVETFAEAVAAGFPGPALAEHMANNPPRDGVRDPVALLKARLRLRPLPPGPDACAGCERWRRQADAAAHPPPTGTDRDRARLAALGIDACPEHLADTSYLPDGRCAACYEREHPEYAEADAAAEAFWSRRRPARAGAA